MLTMRTMPVVHDVITVVGVGIGVVLGVVCGRVCEKSSI
jgi:hypothetical protein